MLSTCGLVMYAGNHDLLCQVGNLNAKNGIESLLNSTTPRLAACWPNKKTISQMTNSASRGTKTFVVDFSSTSLAVPSKIIREVIQRNANEIGGRTSKESLKLS